MGLLLGIAAGDRIGGPIRMALECAESLAGRGAFDPDDLAERYLRWWEREGFDTGPTAEAVFRLALHPGGEPGDEAVDGRATRLTELARQVHQERNGLTAGCNPAHRAAPLAMLASLPDQDLASTAFAEAALTHAHPLAGDVSAFVAVLARALVRGVEWPEAVAEAVRDRLPETRDAVARSRIPSGTSSISGGISRAISRGVFAPEVLHAALATLNASPDFGTAMERALVLAGPANYAPVLVGSLGGARWGREEIPDPLLRMHDGLRKRIEVTGHRLLSGWRLGVASDMG